MLTIADKGGVEVRIVLQVVFRRSKICEKKKHFFMQTWSSYVRLRHNISPKHMTVFQNVMSSFCLNSNAHIGKGGSDRC